MAQRLREKTIKLETAVLTLNCNSAMEIKISNIGQEFCVLGMWSVFV